ncbi:MAG TPA: YbaB/EbfC family nucleoid-associated protein [Candidatus Paceibacterota bacterium]|nr:YbaB/EbfC family nucleoid-associated protein [Candidatus Paceibacterota bacterium]
MFDKLKQLNQIRELQAKLKQEKVEVTESGVRVLMNGEFEVLELTLNPELNIESQAAAIKKCLNEARSQIHKRLASSMAGQLF